MVIQHTSHIRLDKKIILYDYITQSLKQTKLLYHVRCQDSGLTDELSSASKETELNF